MKSIAAAPMPAESNQIVRSWFQGGTDEEMGLTGDGCFVLSLVDKACLDRHYRCHQANHGQQKRTTTNPVNQEPGDEGSQEEPCIQEARHETREMTIKAKTLLEESARVVDQCVNTTQLLECLDAASNQESASALDTIALEKIAPSAGTDRLLDGHGANNVGVNVLDFLVAHSVLVEAGQNFEGFFVTVSGSEPARSLWNDPDDEDHGNQEDALENGGYTPDEARPLSAVRSGESIVNPIDHHDTWR